MTDSWKDRWDERYRVEEFAYGEQPNKYFQDQLKDLAPGDDPMCSRG